MSFKKTVGESMKHRRASILFVIFACICVCAATGLYFAFREPYLQLREGMSRAEVDRTLGGRPSEVLGDGSSNWYGSYGHVRAYFDENGELAECILYPHPPGPMVRFLERIEERMHLRQDPNPNEYYPVRIVNNRYNEFPSGSYSQPTPRILVGRDDKNVISPLIILETDGESSTRR
jgi:hypothetical protein